MFLPCRPCCGGGGGGTCEGSCEHDSDCPAENCGCVRGTCTDLTFCSEVVIGTGWYTADGKTDITALLEDAGYTKIRFEAQQPFVGQTVPLPYTDGCGQTYWKIYATCCGQNYGCTPYFTIGDVRGIAGAGNQQPPCGAAETSTAYIVN